MKAEQAREIRNEAVESLAFRAGVVVNEQLNNILNAIKNRSSEQHSYVVVNMSDIHYSVINRILNLGYRIEDYSCGKCLVRW